MQSWDNSINPQKFLQLFLSFLHRLRNENRVRIPVSQGISERLPMLTSPQVKENNSLRKINMLIKIGSVEAKNGNYIQGVNVMQTGIQFICRYSLWLRKIIYLLAAEKSRHCVHLHPIIVNYLRIFLYDNDKQKPVIVSVLSSTFSRNFILSQTLHRFTVWLKISFS